MKRNLGTLAAAIAVASLAVLAPAARAATSGNATVTLAASANAMIQILTPAITLIPTATDYENDFVEATGASGLQVRVRGNSAGGLVIKVRCPDAAPEIALADLLVRTTTAPGLGGTAMGGYTAISAVDQDLWSTGTSQHAWATVNTDVRIQNLINYDDTVGGSTTDFVNTLTYTVVAQ